MEDEKEKFGSVRSAVQIHLPRLMVLDARWVTTREAARLTGYDTSTICVALRKGHIEGKKIGRDWLVLRDSLLEYKRQMDSLGTDKHNPTRKHKAGD